MKGQAARLVNVNLLMEIKAVARHHGEEHHDRGCEAARTSVEHRSNGPGSGVVQTRWFSRAESGAVRRAALERGLCRAACQFDGRDGVLSGRL